MCVIAIKRQGVKMPDEQTLKTMWTNNPHGAGIMYARDGRVYIDKGYMDWTAFYERIKTLGDVTNESVVIHFRIATHGSVCPGNTHPFPVTANVANLSKLRGSCKVGVAHNGIIRCVTPRKGISDTMEYVATKLAPLAEKKPDWYEDLNVLAQIGHEIQSKLAVLDGKGTISYYGDFIEDEASHMLYSNDSYKPRTYARYTYKDARAYMPWDDRLPWEPGTRIKGDVKPKQRWTINSVSLIPLEDVRQEWVLMGKLSLADTDDLWVDGGGSLYVVDYDLSVAYRLDGCYLRGKQDRFWFFDKKEGIEFDLAGTVSPSYWFGEEV